VRVDAERLEPVLTQLAGEAVVAPSAAQWLGSVLAAAAQIFGVRGAGVLLADADQRLCDVASTDDGAQALERAQEECGEGPCVDAYVQRRTVQTADILQDERWPKLARALAQDGVRAVLGVPIRLRDVVVGTLNVYADAPHVWDESEIAAIAALSGMLEVQLAGAAARFRSEELIRQLEHALAHRVTIERAIGVLMERERLDALVAFSLLRQRARRERRRAIDVAQEILAAAPGGTRPS
jgi:GAF domain-containing protein